MGLGAELSGLLNGREPATAILLPARLPNARDKTRQRHLAEDNTRHTESPNIAARTHGNRATVVQPHGARITRNALQRLVVSSLLQRLTLLCVFGDHLAPLTLTSHPAFLCHELSLSD